MTQITTRQFFDQILPNTGYLTLATPFLIPGTKTTTYVHHKFDNIPAMLDKAADLIWGHSDLFYALGSFRAMEVWNPKKKNYKTGEFGANEFRTQSNSLAMRCLFLDLDVGPQATDSKHFPSKQAAIAALKALCKKVSLPKPMVVDSGGGLHVYWPFTEDVPVDAWRVTANHFKAICLHEQLPIDPTVPADSARVLRVPGSANLKRDTARMVTIQNAAHGPFPFGHYTQLIANYVADNGIAAGFTARKKSYSPGAAADSFGDNIGATNDPANFDRVVFHCGQLASMQANRGATTGYELWRAGLGIAKFCDPQREAALSISDMHPEFDEAVMFGKLSSWNTPPTSCHKFETENAGECAQCPHKGEITTPLQLGKHLRTAPAPTIDVTEDDGTVVAVELPDPPEPYIRTASGSIKMVSEDKDGKPVYESVCPNDLYPIRILRQTGVDSEITENSIWRMHLDRMSTPVDVRIEQGVLGDTRGLHKLLLNAGLYVTPAEIKETQQYMSAYIRHLSKQVDREKIYERMGWHDDHETFVIGGQAVHSDGTVTSHEVSASVKAATKFATTGGVAPKGNLAGWHDAMQFYMRPDSEAHRVFMYLGFASPILHMTGHNGVVFSASGDSGRGKTTAARAQHSIWGHPDSLMINGNKQGATVNGMYATISIIHSLGVSLDDTTDQDPEDMSRLMLNFPQGMDKVRMSGHQHSGLLRTWAQTLTITTNADDITRIAARSSGAEPHMMRVVPVQFATVATDTESKILADSFKRQLELNHGLAGIEFMKYVMPRMAEVQERVLFEMARIDRLVSADSAERYWTAGVAAIYTAVVYAQKAGLLPGFPIEDDLKWLLAHVDTLRSNLVEARVTPLDVLNNFLDSRVSETLAVSAKSTSNLDNVALRPQHTLSVRCDLDGGTIYIARSAITEYCNRTQANFRKVESELYSDRVITNKNCQKVLGADTTWHRGQVRCWVVDANKLGGAFLGAVQAAASQPNTVVPIRKTA